MFGNIIMRSQRGHVGAVKDTLVEQAITKAAGGKKMSMQDIHAGVRAAIATHPAYQKDKYSDGTPKAHIRDIAVGDQSVDNTHAIIDTPTGMVIHPITVDEAGKISLKGEPKPTHTIYKSKFAVEDDARPEDVKKGGKRPVFQGFFGRHTRIAKSVGRLREDPNALETSATGN